MVEVLSKSRVAVRKNAVAEKADLPLGQILPGDCIAAMRSLPSTPRST